MKIWGLFFGFQNGLQTRKRAGENTYPCTQNAHFIFPKYQACFLPVQFSVGLPNSSNGFYIRLCFRIFFQLEQGLLVFELRYFYWQCSSEKVQTGKLQREKWQKKWTAVFALWLWLSHDDTAPELSFPDYSGTFWRVTERVWSHFDFYPLLHTSGYAKWPNGRHLVVALSEIWNLTKYKKKVKWIVFSTLPSCSQDQTMGESTNETYFGDVLLFCFSLSA